MIKAGIFLRYCELKELVSLAIVSPGFVPDEAFTDAVQVATNSRTNEFLSNMLERYTVLEQVPSYLAAGKIAKTPENLEQVTNLYEFLDDAGRQIEQLERDNEKFDVLQYFISNILNGAAKIVSDVNVEFGQFGETLQEFEELQGVPVGLSEKEQLELGELEMGRRRSAREKERLEELRKLNPKMFPSVARMPATEEEKALAEVEKQKLRERMWRKAIEHGIERASRMGIENPEESEQAYKLALEYYDKEAQLTPWTPEEVELWREAMRYGIRQALGTRQLEKGTNPWQSAVVRNFARKYYIEHGGRTVGYRQKERALKRQEIQKMKEERPEKFEQKKQQLEDWKKSLTEEQRKEYEREKQRRKRERRKAKLKQQLPPGYKAPKYTDDQVY